LSEEVRDASLLAVEDEANKEVLWMESPEEEGGLGVGEFLLRCSS